MNAQLMDGTRLAQQLHAETRRRADAVTLNRGHRPCLATVLVGDDPASATYVRMKQRRCAENGVDSRAVTLPASSTTAEVTAAVRSLDADPMVDGILVQHPVPVPVDERAVFETISHAKDVDGVTSASLAAMALGTPTHRSCTPAGILRLLDSYAVALSGLHVVVVGRSEILGLPVGLLSLCADATVTYCHSHTQDLPTQIGRADVLIAAVGRPQLIRGEWIRAGAVVVDAGYHPGGLGDVETATAAERARLITPVPGGVGPMTIAVLISNTVDAAERGLVSA
ncbi:bifunctional 5,10-methylenetetrahydrofolate dehydrogenase/5,10-methenyltetrahydrofolate cyclohydrolase [Gordonia soli]|uniref:Bifunctional protein FolD n=1 Tax=Gordonia soli NBRC 108243 TaxID=1223545 RepID=M0QF21_9ACTN|nr:bifunctional protein FolD [Gordonia soli NBRC 108243]